jgi:cardiolipin synthase
MPLPLWLGALAALLLTTACAPLLSSVAWDEERPIVGSDIRRVLASTGRLPVTHNNFVRVHRGGEESHDAIFRLIAEAQESLYVEMFIFRDDATGREVADALIQRQRAGLDVRVRLDSLGIEYGRTDYRILNRLREGGVTVQINNPWYVSPFGFNVTHRKLFIADGYRVLTGGVNIGDDYRYRYEDLMIEVWGAAARQITGTFAATWGGDLLARWKDPLSDDVQTVSISSLVAPWGDEPIQVALTAPGKPLGNEIRRAYLTAINGAKQSVDVAFPYLWDDALVDALREACRRGIAVRILLPDWTSYDVFHLLNVTSAKDLADVGAQVSTYGERFLHLKYLAIDDAWTSIGSANGDTRSLKENLELNLFFHRETTAKALRSTVFEPLWEAATRAELPEAYAVPRERQWLVPLLEGLDHWM